MVIKIWEILIGQELVWIKFIPVIHLELCLAPILDLLNLPVWSTCFKDHFSLHLHLFSQIIVAPEIDSYLPHSHCPFELPLFSHCNSSSYPLAFHSSMIPLKFHPFFCHPSVIPYVLTQMAMGQVLKFKSSSLHNSAGRASEAASCGCHVLFVEKSPHSSPSIMILIMYLTTQQKFLHRV